MGVVRADFVSGEAKDRRGVSRACNPPRSGGIWLRSPRLSSRALDGGRLRVLRVDVARRADLGEVAANGHHPEVLSRELDLGVVGVKLPGAHVISLRRDQPAAERVAHDDEPVRDPARTVDQR